MDYFRDFVAYPLSQPDPYDRASEQLNPGDILFSATRAFQLIFQTDGNLVLYVVDDSTLPVDITQAQYTKPLWATGTNGKGAVRCNMQTDGNLVLYAANGTPVWASNTNGNPGAFLRCQDDGNLVLYLGARPLWSSGTNARSHGGSMGTRSSPSLQTGFGFQLNAYSPQNYHTVWQQYVMIVADGGIVGVICNWTESVALPIINQYFLLFGLPSGTLLLPAGSTLKIALENDDGGNVSAVTFVVIDNHGVTTNQTIPLDSIGGVTQEDLAPIVAFELDLVGASDTQSAMLSSGAGTFTFRAASDLTPSRTPPDCPGISNDITGESANSIYGPLDENVASRTVTQSFGTFTPEPIQLDIEARRPGRRSKGLPSPPAEIT
jgi:hypothetical protein